MARTSIKIGMILALGLLSACASTPPYTSDMGAPPAYDYPVNNPYAATILGVPSTPGAKKERSSSPQPTEQSVVLFPDRVIPEGFWYERGLRYAQLLQSHPAPLVYIIGGTGSDSRAAQLNLLAGTLYGAGFHVVLLPSPTHQNFIINASQDALADRPDRSAGDVLRAISVIDAKVSQAVPVESRMIAGYSEGAMDAAFTAALADRRQSLSFERVLLLNSPLDITHSIRQIDAMLHRGLPNGIDDADSFIEQQLHRLSSVSPSGDPLDFGDDRLLIRAYSTYKPDDETLSGIIGLAFRVASANMAFASDVMNKSGYIFPKNQPFTTQTDLDHYMSIALRTSLEDYVDGLYVPLEMQKHPGVTRDTINAGSNLETLRSEIAAHPKFGMITNRDDIILAPGEADQLAALFAPNAKVFPNGGHLGNLAHPAVSYEIVRFLKQGAF